MPEEEIISTEPESVSTSASEPSVEADESEPNPLDSWGKPADEAKEEPKTEEPAVKEAPAEEKPAAEPKSEPKSEPKTEEDEVLEELFGDGDDKSEEKTAEKEAEKPKEVKPEEEKEEDIDKLDAKEQIDLQRNKTAKAWAERRDKRAKYIDDFMYDKPIEEVASRFEELNKERFTELRQFAANSLVDENPEGALQRAYVVGKLRQDPTFNWQEAAEKGEIPKLADILNPKVQAATSTTTSEEAKAATKELDSLLAFDWRDSANDSELFDDREKAMVRAIRALEGAPQANPELENQLKAATDELAALKGELTSTKESDHQIGLEKEVKSFRASVEDKMLPIILKNAGLIVTTEDTAEVAKIKEDLASRYTGSAYEKEHDYETPFETFAYHESTVRKELTELLGRIVGGKQKAYESTIAGDAKSATAHNAAVEDERIPLYTLLATANKEFKEKHITPYIRAIGGGLSKSVNQIKEASKRVEMVDTGGETPTRGAPKRSYETADEVWGGMVADAEVEDQLRAVA